VRFMRLLVLRSAGQWPTLPAAPVVARGPFLAVRVTYLP
jgi:hypothetical protein